MLCIWPINRSSIEEVSLCFHASCAHIVGDVHIHDLRKAIKELKHSLDSPSASF
jgi:predicted GNAT superfamily acetyltransferase